MTNLAEADADYNRTTGKTRRGQIYDWCTRQWRWVTLVDLGRQEPVKPADPDEFLKSVDPGPLPDRARGVGYKRIRSAILEKGPLTMRQMAEVVGISYQAVQQVLRVYRSNFVPAGTVMLDRPRIKVKLWDLTEEAKAQGDGEKSH
jgi:hypothetical protein